MPVWLSVMRRCDSDPVYLGNITGSERAVAVTVSEMVLSVTDG